MPGTEFIESFGRKRHHTPTAWDKHRDNQCPNFKISRYRISFSYCNPTVQYSDVAVLIDSIQDRVNETVESTGDWRLVNINIGFTHVSLSSKCFCSEDPC